jgi:glutamate racemase
MKLGKRLFVNKDSSGPIGVFDSGIGGLSVLRALRERLPAEDFLYLGDTARLPYGTRGDETIVRYSLECAAYLLNRGAKAVVAACNTASSIAGDVLQRELPVPFVGMVEPSVSMVERLPSVKSLWILGTEGTVRSGAYEKLLRDRLPFETRIEALACPLFVPLAEEGIASGAICESIVTYYLSSVKEERPDALLLACTHYPMLATTISEYMGSATQVLDGSLAVAGEVAAMLADQGLLREALVESDGESNGSLTCLVTDAAPRVYVLAQRFLSERGLTVEKISLDSKNPGGSAKFS